MLFSQVKQLIPYSVKQSLGSLADPKTFYIMKTARLHPAPIFILGYPKSGTTVVASLLAKISNQPVTIDLFPKIDPQEQLQEKLFSREVSFSDFVQSHRFYFSTPLNKAPKFTFFYDELRQCFPIAKFIFVIRDPRDTIRSLLNRREIPGNLNKLQSLKGKSAHIGRLPPVAGDYYIEKLANRWNLAANTYINHADEISLIRYEDFVLDKIGTISSLARKVGLNAIKDITDYVDIQYQPRGDRNVSWVEFFGTNNLRCIETICSDRMNYFGYSLSP